MKLPAWLKNIFPIDVPTPMDNDSAIPSLVLRPYSGSLFRLHERQHLYDEPEFWRTFLDGPWKWRGQERFAGSHYNCGHYFALTADGARSEAEFYKITGDRVLLEVKATFKSLLDLTDLRCLRHIWSLTDARKPDCTTIHHEYILAFLADENPGGNPLTDTIGLWARRNDYDGIMFYSARAIDAEQRRRIKVMKDYDWSLEEGCGFTSEVGCRELQENRSIQNLVALSGTAVTTAISEFRVPGGAWIENPYHRYPIAQLDDLMERHGTEYGRKYQDDKEDYIFVRDPNNLIKIVPRR